MIFCRPSPLQLTLYRQFIRCSLIRRCLSGNLTGAPHLTCIGALKQLCNHPGLTYRKAAEVRMMNREKCDDQEKSMEVNKHIDLSNIRSIYCVSITYLYLLNFSLTLYNLV